MHQNGHVTNTWAVHKVYHNHYDIHKNVCLVVCYQWCFMAAKKTNQMEAKGLIHHTILHHISINIVTEEYIICQYVSINPVLWDSFHHLSLPTVLQNGSNSIFRKKIMKSDVAIVHVLIGF